jgi:hypothetical protein
LARGQRRIKYPKYPSGIPYIGSPILMCSHPLGFSFFLAPTTGSLAPVFEARSLDPIAP